MNVQCSQGTSPCEQAVIIEMIQKRLSNLQLHDSPSRCCGKLINSFQPIRMQDSPVLWCEWCQGSRRACDCGKYYIIAREEDLWWVYQCGTSVTAHSSCLLFFATHSALESAFTERVQRATLGSETPLELSGQHTYTLWKGLKESEREKLADAVGKSYRETCEYWHNPE